MAEVIAIGDQDDVDAIEESAGDIGSNITIRRVRSHWANFQSLPRHGNTVHDPWWHSRHGLADHGHAALSPEQTKRNCELTKSMRLWGDRTWPLPD